MPINPDIADFLELANLNSQPKLQQQGVELARENYDNSTLFLDGDCEAPFKDYTFNSSDNMDLTIRCFGSTSLKKDISKAPSVLFLHGGGYVLGGLESHASLCATIAEKSNCLVFSLDYRKAPEYKFPTAFNDTLDAYNWLLTNAATLNIDTNKIAVAGDSVGGTLATSLCISLKESSSPSPIMQVLLYPCTSAYQDSDSHKRLAQGYLLEKDTLQWMFNQYLVDNNDRKDWRFAPLEYKDLSGLPPAWIGLAEYDPLVDEGVQYNSKLRDAGIDTELTIYSGMIHDFARFGNLVDDAETIRIEIGNALSIAFNS
jgi:acetyl esterase